MDTHSHTRPAGSEAQAIFRRWFSYDPEKGFLSWRESPSNGVKAGDLAGCHTGRHIVVGVGGRLYLAHVVAWVMQTGSWPRAEVDHINCTPDDNRWANLRDVSHGINSQNVRRARKSNRLGLLGVSAHSNGRFRATIVLGGKQRHLGYHATAEQAQGAYLEAKRRLHEGCTL
jgi:hypothetical protein